MLAQKLDECDQYSRRAKTALQAVIVAKRLLQRMQMSGPGRGPSTVVIWCPLAWTASIRHERARWSSE
jgi:hypothetical protein